MDGSPVDDRGLAAQAHSGDVEAFRQLVVRYQTIAFRAAFLIVHDATEAEDIAQEAFIKAFDALATFREGAPFQPWLLRIVTNEARNRVRGRARRVHVLRRAAQQRPHGQHVASPEALVLADERDARVAAAVRKLAERDRVVVLYRYYLDLSVAEIATILACPERTVRSRLRRALEQLERQLTADLVGNEPARQSTDHGVSR